MTFILIVYSGSVLIFFCNPVWESTIPKASETCSSERIRWSVSFYGRVGLWSGSEPINAPWTFFLQMMMDGWTNIWRSIDRTSVASTITYLSAAISSQRRGEEVTCVIKVRRQGTVLFKSEIDRSSAMLPRLGKCFTVYSSKQRALLSSEVADERGGETETESSPPSNRSDQRRHRQ